MISGYDTYDGSYRNFLSKQAKERDKIIFGSYDPNAYMGGIRKFKNLEVRDLRTLVNKGFADPEDAQNNSPTLGELLNFAEEYGPNSYVFDGYVVSPNRSDCRVSVDSIKMVDNDFYSDEEEQAFEELTKYADEKDFGYAWWD